MRLFDDPAARVLVGGSDEEMDSFAMPGSDDWTLGISQDEAEDFKRSLRLGLGSAPNLSSWKKPTDDEVFASVDKARADCGKQADDEFNFILQRLKDNGIISEGEVRKDLKPNEIYRRLVNWIFGPDSRLFRLFEEKVPYVKGNHSLFSRCIATFFTSCYFDEDPEKLQEGPFRRWIFLQARGLADAYE